MSLFKPGTTGTWHRLEEGSHLLKIPPITAKELGAGNLVAEMRGPMPGNDEQGVPPGSDCALPASSTIYCTVEELKKYLSNMEDDLAKVGRGKFYEKGQREETKADIEVIKKTLDTCPPSHKPEYEESYTPELG